MGGGMLLTSFGKRYNLGLRKSPFHDAMPFFINLSAFGFSHEVVSHGLVGIKGTIWFNALQWHEKMHQVIWSALQDYGRIEWKHTLSYLKKAPNVTYQDILKKIGSFFGVNGLIVTRSNLVVTWKVRPRMGTITWFTLWLRWLSRGGCILIPSCNWFSICAKKKNQQIFLYN